MLTAFLRSLVSRDDVVDEVFQQTMLVAWRRLGDYDRSRPFGPWLRGIAAKLILAERRRAAVHASRCTPEVLEALEDRFAALDRRPGDSFLDRAALLKECLEKLPALLRETVELTYGRGLILGEVARSVAASEEAVKKRIQRARGLLAECIEGASPRPEAAP